jgi:hypothetical protein
MSGLTIGLLGMDVNTLEILKRQGTEKEVRSKSNRAKLGYQNGEIQGFNRDFRDK